MIYIVEDDETLREIVLYALSTAGLEPQGFETGAEFFAALEKSVPSLVLLDIMLPRDDGLSILKRIRSTPGFKDLPVIMLTAKSAEYDKIKGFDLGADDYVTKPFSVMELISRIKAVLRRSKSPQAAQLTFGSIAIDPNSREVTVDNTKVTLTFKEYELLHYLMLNAGAALSRSKIMDIVWGFDFEGESRTLDMHVRSLRQKLGNAGAYIQTIRNIGYKLGE